MFLKEGITAFLVLALFQAHLATAAVCTRYQGGISTFFGREVHRYACCNNCGDSDTSCDSQTYHGGSNQDYCGSCGSSSWPSSSRMGSFSCEGCSEQNSCDSNCWYWDWPLGCWCWVNCFQRCCARAYSRGKRSIAEMEFCGNGVCSEEETVANCPMDCCQQINTACTLRKGECIPECCGEPSCCMGVDAVNHTTIATTEISRYASGQQPVRVTLQVSLGFFLFSIVLYI